MFNGICAFQQQRDVVFVFDFACLTSGWISFGGCHLGRFSGRKIYATFLSDGLGFRCQEIQKPMDNAIASRLLGRYDDCQVLKILFLFCVAMISHDGVLWIVVRGYSQLYT